jgi:hypothetical protein
VAHECRHGLPALGLSGCYDELKSAAFRGEKLTQEELEFAGFYPTPPSEGWRPATNLSISYELDASLSPEDSELLAALMTVGDERERLEFLA